MLRFLRTTRLALKSLLLHKLRSGLTMLGIVFGVFSVIAMLAIGEGASTQAQKQVLELGATNVIVRTVKPQVESSSSGNSRSGFVHSYGITRDDLAGLRAIPTVETFVPIREQREEASFGRNRAGCRIVGVTPEYGSVNRLRPAAGTFIADRHVQDVDNVAVLAAELATDLFPIDDPLGKTITVGNDSYLVVGVMRPRSATAAVGGSLAGQDYSKDVYVPLPVFDQRRTDLNVQRATGSFSAERVELNQVTLVVPDEERVIATAEAVREAMELSHGEKRDYSVVVPLELLEQAKQIRTIFNVVLGSIAAISLVVGGIGIMNIMLATVTERTREIGVRRALGATRGDVTSQFLTETVVLSGTGGVVGVVLGLLTPWAFVGVQWFVRSRMLGEGTAGGNELANMFIEMEPAIAWWSLPLAFGFSVAIGVLFGLYPARAAARLDPIEALRHV